MRANLHSKLHFSVHRHALLAVWVLLLGCQLPAPVTIDTNRNLDTGSLLDMQPTREDNLDTGMTEDAQMARDSRLSDGDIENIQDADLEMDAGLMDCGEQTLCPNGCQDLNLDILNCGQCGNECTVQSAVAQCVAGQCEIATCDEGFLDLDGQYENGCEFFNDCTEGQACSTFCGSHGLTECVGHVESCAPPQEGCNLVDDDCDQACDEGLIGSCRREVIRAYGRFGHIYTTNRDHLALGFDVESASYFTVYTQPQQGLAAIFLCRNQIGGFYLSLSSNCDADTAVIQQVGYIATQPTCDSIPLYSLFNPNNGYHFYTIDPNERIQVLQGSGFVDFGIGGYVWPGQ